MNSRIIITLLVVACLCTAAGRRRVLLTGKAPSGAAAPTEVTDFSSLFVWLKPDTGITNTSGSAASDAQDVQLWGDSSGNGRNVRTNRPSTPPRYYSSGTTGKTYGGIGCDTSETLAVGFSPQSETTIFVVFKVAGLGVTTVAIDSTNSSARQVIYKGNTDNFRAYSGSDLASGSASVNTWYIAAAVFNSGGNDQLWLNGSQLTTGSSGNQSLDGLCIGADLNGNAPMLDGGYIGEVVAFNRNMNSTEIGQMFGILNGRWLIY